MKTVRKSGESSVGQDITERNKTDENLLIRDKAIATSIDAIVFADPKGILTYVNQAFLKMWGYASAEEVLGKSSIDFWQFEEKAEMVIKALEDQGGWEGELTGKRKDGTLFDVQLSSSLVKDANGKTICMMGSFKDVTTRKWAERELKIKDYAISSSINAIVFNDLDGIIIYANDAFTQMMGFKSDKEFLGKHPTEITVDREKTKKILEAVENEGKWVGEETVRRKDGSIMYTQHSASLVKDSTGKPIMMMASFVDITERKRMEEELESAHKKSVQSEKLATVGLLAAGVAHEINNPLTIIMGSVQMLLELIKKEGAANIDSNIYTKALGMTERATIRCRKIVADLQVFSSPAKIQLDPIDMRELVEESLDILEDKIKTHKVKVINDFAPNLSLIKADKYKLGGVVNNLITNACDAMPEGGQLKITTRLSPPRTEPSKEAGGEASKTVEIEFSDTGEGISEENMARIFDPFFTTKDTNKGTGLGLSICHGIIKEHGGSIDVKSEKGKGTTFIVTLPVEM